MDLLGWGEVVQVGDAPGGEEQVPHPAEHMGHHQQGEPARTSALQ